jgi:hypothetical protein
MTNEEIEAAQAALDRGAAAGRVAFYRAEIRHTKSERVLDCHCRIPPRMEYRYAVWKVVGVDGVMQSTTCDYHMRIEEGSTSRAV